MSTCNKEAGGGRNSRNYLCPKTIGFPSSYSSVWICSHSRLDANHVIRPLLSPACTFSPCVTQPVIAKAILFPGLNDATSAVESFPVLSFPQAFTPPAYFRGKLAKWIRRCHHRIFFSVDLFTEIILIDRQRTIVWLGHIVASDVHSPHILLFSLLNMFLTCSSPS